MLNSVKFVSFLVVTAFFVPKVTSFPVPTAPDYSVGFPNEFPNPMDDNDFANSPTQASYFDSESSGYFEAQTEKKGVRYALVASGSAPSDYHAYKNGEPISFNQLPESLKNFNPKTFEKKFDKFFAEPFFTDPFFADDSSKNAMFGDFPFSYFM